MRVLQAGPDSVHVVNFCKAMHPLTGDFIYFGEQTTQIPGAIESHFFKFRGWNLTSLISSYFQLKNILKKAKPNLIHIHQANRLAFVITRAAGKLKIPVILTAWGSDVLLIPEKNFVFKAITRSILKHAQIVTADSGEMIEAMKKLHPSGKYVRLQYGIDPIHPTEKENIIFSNRLHQPLYQIDTIIHEFAAFSKQHEEWKLYIGGDGEETENLMKLTESLDLNDKIKFTGWLSKVFNDKMYAKSRIYASIPSSDGTSVSLLEALSAGCIPVASDLPSNKEWISDGINGVIYAPGNNPFEMALKLDPEKCEKLNAEKIRMHALRSNTIPEFYELYKQVIA